MKVSWGLSAFVLPNREAPISFAKMRRPLAGCCGVSAARASALAPQIRWGCLLLSANNAYPLVEFLTQGTKMGFFDWLMSLLGGGDDDGNMSVVTITRGVAKTAEDKYFFADDEEKVEIVRKVGAGVAAVFGGTTKERRTFDGDELPGEIHVTGHFLDAAVRVKLGITFGGFDVELKLAERLEADLDLDYYEKGKADYESQRTDRDEWDDDDDRGESRHFVSDHLNFEGDDEEVTKAKDLFARLPEGLRTELIDALEPNEGEFRFYGDSVKLNCGRRVMPLPNVVDTVTQFLTVGVKLHAAIGAAWADVTDDD